MSSTRNLGLFALLLYILWLIIQIGCDIQQTDDRLNRIETHPEIPAE